MTKPKFKIGDIITEVDNPNQKVCVVTDIEGGRYHVSCHTENNDDYNAHFCISSQNQWKFMSEKTNEDKQQTRFLLYKNNGELEYLPISDSDTITSTGDGLCVMKVDGSCKYCDMITIEDNQIDIKGLCDDFLDRYKTKAMEE